MVERRHDGSIIITLADVYAKVCEVDAKVNAMGPQAGELRDHEKRLRSLERWRYGLIPAGGAGLAAAVLSLIHH